MNAFIGRKMIVQTTKRKIPKKENLKGKYDNANVKKLRFKANKEFLPTQSAGRPSAVGMTPLPHDMSLWRPSEAPLSLITSKPKALLHPSPKGLNDSDASVKDGLLPPTPENDGYEDSSRPLGKTFDQDNNQSHVIYVLPEV